MSLRYVIRPGDCLASVAAQFGFSDPAAIHDHADNADLKQRRADPHLLVPGDVVMIPDRVEKEIDCAAGARHRFTLKQPRVVLRLKLQDQDGAAVAGKPYRLFVGDEIFEGKTGGDGLIEQRVPPEIVEAEIVYWPAKDDAHGARHLHLRIGYLDPHDTPSGVQARLHNLGYYGGPLTGAIDAPTLHAIQAFRRAQGLEGEGGDDDAFRGKLRDAHGT